MNIKKEIQSKFPCTGTDGVCLKLDGDFWIEQPLIHDETISPQWREETNLVAGAKYTSSSVLAGQFTTQLVHSWNTKAQAIASLGEELFTALDVRSDHVFSEATVSDIAPVDFSPADAGEEW